MDSLSAKRKPHRLRKSRCSLHSPRPRQQGNEQRTGTENQEGDGALAPPFFNQKIIMTKVSIIFARAKDGTYSAYCEDAPMLFGMGDTAEDARKDLEETLRITKEEIGKESAGAYPDWLDGEYEFAPKWDVQAMLEYYAGIITPAALSRISGIHPKQLWSYLHGRSKPRKEQVCRIESALHKLGAELMNTSF